MLLKMQLINGSMTEHIYQAHANDTIDVYKTYIPQNHGNAIENATNQWSSATIWKKQGHANTACIRS